MIGGLHKTEIILQGNWGKVYLHIKQIKKILLERDFPNVEQTRLKLKI